jgi:alanine racemase
VLVDGQRSRIVGRVSMDMITVDLTGLDAAGIGSEAVMWGRSRAQPHAVLTADEVAQAAGTISYELTCGVAQRVPFVVD